tara:strand:- start:126 stop:263 length:138 start_codon:yes stop_codon:yes gene_type:complete
MYYEDNEPIDSILDTFTMPKVSKKEMAKAKKAAKKAIKKEEKDGE